MNAPREEWHLDTRHLGRRVLIFDRVGSTNTLATELARAPDSVGLAILADEQTAGRGQHGRTWLAPARASVLLSLVLAPPPPLRRPVVLTAWVAVSVCQVVREFTDWQARIKWPNDVLIHGKKVCGILIEQAHGGPAPATIVGIGLNVRQSAAELADLPQATSLSQLAGAPLDTAEVARRLLAVLDTEYDLLQQGQQATLEACWKWHVGLLGKPVVAECADGHHCGRLLDLGFDGVELERPGEPPLVLRPETVLHLTAEQV